jgi:hypothetical protein
MAAAVWLTSAADDITFSWLHFTSNKVSTSLAGIPGSGLLPASLLLLLLLLSMMPKVGRLQSLSLLRMSESKTGSPTSLLLPALLLLLLSLLSWRMQQVNRLQLLRSLSMVL